MKVNTFKIYSTSYDKEIWKYFIVSNMYLHIILKNIIGHTSFIWGEQNEKCDWWVKWLIYVVKRREWNEILFRVSLTKNFN